MDANPATAETLMTKRLTALLLFILYNLSIITSAHANPTTSGSVAPCSACVLRAPEFDLNQLVWGVILIIGTILLFAEHIRKSGERQTRTSSSF